MWTCRKCSKKVDDTFEICWSCGTSIDGVEDPHFFDEPSAEPRTPKDVPENLVRVTKYLLGPEAYAMGARLQSEGIPVFIFDEMTTTVGLLSNTASEGAQLQVPDHCLARAREILGIVEEEQEVDENEEKKGDGSFDEDAGDDTDAPLDEGIIDRDRQMDVPEEQGIIDKSVTEGIAKPPGEQS